MRSVAQPDPLAGLIHTGKSHQPRRFNLVAESSVNQFPRKRTRLERQYDLGWRSYEKGVRFDHYADHEWQRGFKDARDAGAFANRPRVRIGDVSGGSPGTNAGRGSAG